MCYIANSLESPEPFKSVSALSRVDPSASYCPSMMDDGVYRSSIPLALLPLIGLKPVHLDSTRNDHWQCLSELFQHVLPCYCLSNEDRAASGQSPSQQNRFGTQALSHSVAYFGKQCIDAAKEKLAYWHCD